jgi:hypothetical protein
MTRNPGLTFAAAVAALGLVAGCPNSGTDNTGTTTGAALLAGTWSGPASCSRVQTLGMTTSDAVVTDRQFSITVNADGRPTSVPILGFSDSPNQNAALGAKGDSVTLTTTTSGGINVTQIVTVSELTFDDDRLTMDLTIDFMASGGALTQDGSATQRITLTLSGANATLLIDTDYTVTQTAGSLRLDTSEATTCNGSLPKQP